MTLKNQNKVVIGCLGSVFGVRGQLKVNSYTTPFTNILEYPNWQIQHKGQWQPLAIENLKRQGNMIVLKIDGIDDRDIAKTFTNDLIAIERDELPDAEENEYYWSDLVGLKVITTNDFELGTIIEMRETGANDVMIIKGENRHLVPFIDDILQSIDLENKVIIVDWDHEF
jgi:16S rRNA processing protein RimM